MTEIAGRLTLDPTSAKSTCAERPDTPSTGRKRPRRDDAVDRLRGLCLLSMTVAHIALVNNQQSFVDGVVHFPVWVSGAAGFVFLSGTSIGLFWTGRGGATTANRIWAFKRGVFLGMLAIVLNLFGIAWFRLIGPPDWHPTVEPTLSAVFTARWSLLFANVMWMYAGLLVAVAAVGRLLLARPLLGLAASFGVYVCAQFGPAVGPTLFPGGAVTWNLLAWQFLLVSGLLAGAHWNNVRDALDRHSRVVWWLGGAALVAIASLRLGFNFAERGFDPVGLGDIRETLQSGLLGKTSLGPARLALIFGLGPAAYLLNRNRTPLDRLIVPAGTRSLRVFFVSTVVAYLWTATEVGSWPTVNAEVAVVAATAAVLASGMLPAVGKGRPWSF